MSKPGLRERLFKRRPKAWDVLDLILSKLEGERRHADGAVTVILSASEVELIRRAHAVWEDPAPILPRKPWEDT